MRFLLLLLTLIGFSPLANAQFGVSASSAASLISENTAIAPGQTFSVALELSHPEEWHSYYLNSGGVELPPSIAWKLPPGFTAGPIQWPVPQVKDGYFGKSFIYSGSPVFLVDITPPADLAPGGTVTLTADAKWQICKESCINEQESFTLSLQAALQPQKDPERTGLFARARSSQPARTPGLAATAVSSGGPIELRVSPATAISGQPVDFIPNERFVQPASAGGNIRKDGDAWVVTLNRVTTDALDNPVPQGTSLSGILVGDGGGVAIPETTLARPPAPPLPAAGFLRVVAGMFLGGLILNLMPCVFPVIGLKIMGFVQQSGEDRRKIAFHGLAFTLGVLLSFAVLSGVLFAFRSTVGWGYQLQDPRIVLALMVLMFVLALNMAGLFELGASATSVGGSLQSKQGVGGSFFSGVLATVVATPCSAPFLGAAIGAAIGLPAVQFFTAFAAMAIGLSLPYLLLSIFPGLLKFLPRPGAWMESFKQAMSFLLFATAGYLLWVYAGQIGLDNLLAPLFGLCVLAVAGWIYGRWNLPHRSKSTRATALVLSLLFAIGGLFLMKPPAKSALVWEPWSQDRADTLLAAGTPVYIDFTAQWCATCQVNKKVAYTKDVIDLMKSKGVVALKADKTVANPAIEEKLKELGRTAIPVNVLLVPGREPVVTPELLTPAYLKELFGKIP